MRKQIKIVPYSEKKHDTFFSDGRYMGCIHIRSNESNDICASSLLFDRDMEYGEPKQATEEFLRFFLKLNCLKSVEAFNDLCLETFGDLQGEKVFFFKDVMNAYKIQAFCNEETFNINVHINKL